MRSDGEPVPPLPFWRFRRQGRGLGSATAIRSVAAMAFLAAVATVLALSLPDESLHSSDVLYGPAFVGDLFAGTPVGLWALTPAPYFFPDLGLYAAAHGVVRPFWPGPASIDAGLRLTLGLLFVFDAVAFAFLLWRVAGRSLMTGLLSYCAFALIAVQAGGLREGFLSAMIPTNHSGLVSGVFLFWGLWGESGRGVDEGIGRLRKLGAAWRSIGVAVVVIVWGISDAQFFSLTVLPAGLIWVVQRLVGLTGRSQPGAGPVEFLLGRVQPVSLMVAVLLGFVVAMRVVPLLRYGVTFFPPVDVMALWKNMSYAGPAVVSHVFLRQESVVRHVQVAAVIGGLLAAWLYRARHLERMNAHAEYARSYSRMALHATVAALAGLLGVLSLHGGVEINAAREGDPNLAEIPVLPFAFRYLNFVHAFYYPLVFGVVVGLLRIFSRRWMRIPGYAGLLVLLAAGWMRTPSRPEEPAALREARCVDQALHTWNGGVPLAERVHPPFYGISDYWHAKRLMLFSDGMVRPLAVHDRGPGELLFWITNLQWYLESPAPEYRFVIANGLQEQPLRAHFGEPLDRRTCEGLQVFWYGPESPIRFAPEDMWQLARTLGLPGARPPRPSTRTIPSVPTMEAVP